jgi:hypothetical protein
MLFVVEEPWVALDQLQQRGLQVAHRLLHLRQQPPIGRDVLDHQLDHLLAQGLGRRQVGQRHGLCGGAGGARTAAGGAPLLHPLDRLVDLVHLLQRLERPGHRHTGIHQVAGRLGWRPPGGGCRARLAAVADQQAPQIAQVQQRL